MLNDQHQMFERVTEFEFTILHIICLNINQILPLAVIATARETARLLYFPHNCFPRGVLCF